MRKELITWSPLKNEIPKALKTTSDGMLGVVDMTPSSFANQGTEHLLKLSPSRKGHKGLMDGFVRGLILMIDTFRRVKCHHSTHPGKGFAASNPLSLLSLIDHIKPPRGIEVIRPPRCLKTRDSIMSHIQFRFWKLMVF